MSTPKFWSVCLLKACSHTQRPPPQRECRQWPLAPPVPRQCSCGPGVTSQGAFVALLFRLESQPRSGSIWLLVSFSLLAALLRQSTPTCTRETLSRPRAQRHWSRAFGTTEPGSPLDRKDRGCEECSEGGGSIPGAGAEVLVLLCAQASTSLGERFPPR